MSATNNTPPSNTPGKFAAMSQEIIQYDLSYIPKYIDELIECIIKGGRETNLQEEIEYLREYKNLIATIKLAETSTSIPESLLNALIQEQQRLKNSLQKVRRETFSTEIAHDIAGKIQAIVYKSEELIEHLKPETNTAKPSSECP